MASLWDVASGTQIGTRLTAGQPQDAHRLFRPTVGDCWRRTATARQRVWDIDPESWKQRACAIANRTLTREEWEEFLPGRPYEPACGG